MRPHGSHTRKRQRRGFGRIQLPAPEKKQVRKKNEEKRENCLERAKMIFSLHFVRLLRIQISRERDSWRAFVVRRELKNDLKPDPDQANHREHKTRMHLPQQVRTTLTANTRDAVHNSLKRVAHSCLSALVRLVWILDINLV